MTRDIFLLEPYLTAPCAATYKLDGCRDDALGHLVTMPERGRHDVGCRHGGRAAAHKPCGGLADHIEKMHPFLNLVNPFCGDSSSQGKSAAPGVQLEGD